MIVNKVNTTFCYFFVLWSGFFSALCIFCPFVFLSFRNCFSGGDDSGGDDSGGDDSGGGDSSVMIVAVMIVAVVIVAEMIVAVVIVA